MAPSIGSGNARRIKVIATLIGLSVTFLMASLILTLFSRTLQRRIVEGAFTDRDGRLSPPVRSNTRLPASICESLDGYRVIDKSPIRSPLLVADHLIEHSRDRVIFEIGTRHGDILDCVSRYTKGAYSVEINRKYCDALRERGLIVLCEDVLNVRLADLPELPDVFFWWPMDARKQNEVWLKHIRQQVAAAPSNERVAIIGFDNKWKKDIYSKMQMLKKYPDAKEYTIEFAEGDEWRAHGNFSVVHFPLA